MDRNSNIDYRIFIPGTTGHQMTSPHQTCVAALPGESRTNEILHFFAMQYDCLFKITYI